MSDGEDSWDGFKILSEKLKMNDDQVVSQGGLEGQTDLDAISFWGVETEKYFMPWISPFQLYLPLILLQYHCPDVLPCSVINSALLHSLASSVQETVFALGREGCTKV